MQEVVELVKIRIPSYGSAYYEPNGHRARIGEWYVVEDKYHHDLGEVLWKYPCGVDKIPPNLYKLVRRANEDDLMRAAEYRVEESEAYQIALEKIAYHRLPMKLSRVRYSIDGDRIVFFFYADHRVDFRALVRDLARIFRRRIELIQIGVRDEAALIGDCGRCGMPLCCTTFLKDIQPITIKMAKTQGLSLTPSKISGSCGRLLCCLQYENTWYAWAKSYMPKRGHRVQTPRGLGIVEDVTLFDESMRVRFRGGETEEYEANQAENARRGSRYGPENREEG